MPVLIVVLRLAYLGFNYIVLVVLSIRSSVGPFGLRSRAFMFT